MSVLNRVIVSIVAVIIGAVSIICIVVTVDAVSPDVMPTDWFDVPFERAADTTGGKEVAIIAVCILITLLMIGLLFAELMWLKKRVSFNISSTEAGIVTIDRDSIIQLAEKTALGTHDVSVARCNVADTERGLNISCRAYVALGSNIPEVSKEAQERIKEAVEQLTGLTVAEVNVTTRYAKTETKRLAVR